MRRHGGRPWKCLLCTERGTGRDEAENTASFYKHYMAKHMTKEGE